MEAHIGGVVFYTTFHMNVHALGKTKPPSGGSQGVISTLATNKQKKIQSNIKQRGIKHRFIHAKRRSKSLAYKEA